MRGVDFSPSRGGRPSPWSRQAEIVTAPFAVVKPQHGWPPSAAQLASDQDPLDLGSALSDLVDLGVTPVSGHWVLLYEPIAAVNLDRLVRRTLGRFRRVQLGHRSQPL